MSTDQEKKVTCPECGADSDRMEDCEVCEGNGCVYPSDVDVWREVRARKARKSIAEKVLPYGPGNTAAADERVAVVEYLHEIASRPFWHRPNPRDIAADILEGKHRKGDV